MASRLRHGPSGDARTTAPSEASETWLEEILEDSRPVAHPAPANDGAALTGRLVGLDEGGRVLFLEDGSTDVPVPVTIALPLSDDALVQAVARGERALVLRAGGSPPRLVLTGLLRERVAATASDATPRTLQVSLDGDAVVLSAERRIELRCGKSSLVLTRDGHVILKGAHVVSRSSGPNKIKGASIALN